MLGRGDERGMGTGNILVGGQLAGVCLGDLCGEEDDRAVLLFFDGRKVLAGQDDFDLGQRFVEFALVGQAQQVFHLRINGGCFGAVSLWGVFTCPLAVGGLLAVGLRGRFLTRLGDLLLLVFGARLHRRCTLVGLGNRLGRGSVGSGTIRIGCPVGGGRVGSDGRSRGGRWRCGSSVVGTGSVVTATGQQQCHDNPTGQRVQVQAFHDRVSLLDVLGGGS